MPSQIICAMILSTSWLLVGHVMAKDFPEDILNFMSVMNGNFDDLPQIERDSELRERVHFKIVPVEVPALSDQPVLYFEKTVDGNVVLIGLLSLAEGSGGIILVILYTFMDDPSQYKPESYNLDDLVSLSPDSLRTDQICAITFEVVSPTIYMGTWTDCRRTVLGKHPVYVGTVRCDTIDFASPVVADEPFTSLPYNCQREEDKPGSYNLDDLVSLSPDSLRTDHNCTVTFEVVSPNIYMGTWTDCRRTLLGKHPVYVGTVGCDAINFAYPVVADEPFTSLPYNCQREEDKPGSYNLDDLVSLSPDSLRTDHNCTVTFEVVSPNIYMGTWTDCRRTLLGKHPVYVGTVGCDAINFAYPVVADEPFTSLPYNCQREEDKPGSYNLDDLVSLSPDSLRTDHNCTVTFEVVSPNIYMGTWTDCRRTVLGKHPVYVGTVRCDAINFVSPVVSDEPVTSQSYTCQREGDKYPLVGAPPGYVSPCDKKV